jgi:chaperonin cofactor prefoldin
MSKEELISEYNRVEKTLGDLSIKLLELISDTYEERIETSDSIDTLDEIWKEIKDEDWPNTVGTFLMFKKINERKKELNQDKDE